MKLPVFHAARPPKVSAMQLVKIVIALKSSVKPPIIKVVISKPKSSTAFKPSSMLRPVSMMFKSI